MDLYPVESRIVEGLKPDSSDAPASTFGDVGGRLPVVHGQLVLQELPEVIAAATAKGVGADGRIKLQTHDFFTPQPVKGARVYFMRTILHDCRFFIIGDMGILGSGL
ncbi:hypothetical protein PG989_014662 [Apiospora arundinis]